MLHLTPKCITSVISKNIQLVDSADFRQFLVGQEMQLRQYSMALNSIDF